MCMPNWSQNQSQILNFVTEKLIAKVKTIINHKTKQHDEVCDQKSIANLITLHHQLT